MAIWSRPINACGVYLDNTVPGFSRPNPSTDLNFTPAAERDYTRFPLPKLNISLLQNRRRRTSSGEVSERRSPRGATTLSSSPPGMIRMDNTLDRFTVTSHGSGTVTTVSNTTTPEIWAKGPKILAHRRQAEKRGGRITGPFLFSLPPLTSNARGETSNLICSKPLVGLFP